MTTPTPGNDEVSTRDDGAVVAQGDGSGSSKTDYDTWGWKEIMARITGAGAIGSKARDELGQSHNSDPQSLWNAALSFRMAQEVLVLVGKSVADQTKALAGEGGPWEGEAATAFHGLMEQFSKAFHNHAEQIGGGAATQYPVPEQLWTAGNYLAWAIKTVYEIDNFYANEALRIAAASGEDIIIESDKGDLVHVGKYPEIVKLLDRDMRQVLKTLASQYETQRFDTSLSPVPTPNPTGPPGGTDTFDPNAFVPPPVTPSPAVPNVDIPPPGGSVPPSGSGPGSFDPASFDPASFDPGSFDPSSFNGGTGGPGQLTPGGSGSGAFDPAGFTPGDASIAPPPGSSLTPGGNGPGAFDPAPFPGGTGVNAPGLPGGGTAFVPPPASFGGSTPPPGTTGRGNTSTPGGATPSDPGQFTPGTPDLSTPFPPGQFPGIDVPDPNDWAAGPGPGSAGGDNRGIGTPSGMPMMPPGAPFGPGAGGGANGSERSDASGLVGDETGAWEGVDVPGLGDPIGVSAPDPSTQDWTAQGSDQPAGLGVPMMPGMPMAPAAGNGANGPERSDASGLVAGATEPWEGGNVAGIGDPVGVQALPSEQEEWAQTTSGQLMPFIPVVPPVPGEPGEKRREAVGGAAVFSPGEQTPVVSVPAAGVDPAPAAVEANRVAVVRLDDGDEDFSAWDAGAATGLPWLLTPGRSRDERDEEPEKPDYTLRETTGWGHTAGSTGVGRTADSPAVAAPDLSDFLPRFEPPRMKFHSSGLDAPEEEEPTGETDDSQEEQEERTSGDLLKQDEGVWAGGAAAKASPGVIE